MNRRWVVNASPLIILGKLSLLHLLPELAETLIVPAAVAEEVSQGPEADQARTWISGTGSRFVRDASPIEPVVAGWDLGAGETHVLSWAVRGRGFEVILDDLASRKCAASLAIPVRGTLGVLLTAKKDGRLAHLQPFLDQAVGAGLHISPEVLVAVRRLAGEGE